MAHIKSRTNRLGTSITVLLVLAIFTGSPKPGEARSKKIIHSFALNGTDGATPSAGLVTDGNGVLYGTTQLGGVYDLGTVFSLTPPATTGGAWSEQILYSFSGGGDGAQPLSALLVGRNGVLYGTTAYGGAGLGVVFSLAPPLASGGSWVETALHSFTGGTDGSRPTAGLVSDASGVLYGTTSGTPGDNYGTVFELTPPTSLDGNWTETVLHHFGSTFPDGVAPEGRLMIGRSGVLYGTTSGASAGGYGTVFSLAPPNNQGGSWTEQILYTFTLDDGHFPLSGLSADKKGLLYGTTSDAGPGGGCGTVYTVAPPAASGGMWIETVLHTFSGSDGCNPSGEVALTKNHALFGNNSGQIAFPPNFDGTLWGFRYTSPSGPLTQTLLSFEGSPSDGANPFGALLIGRNGELYGTTAYGGAFNSGTAFEVTP